MSKFNILLWDIDGTLLDFIKSEHWSIKNGFQRFGWGECTDEMIADYSQINKKYWEMLERGEMSKAEILVNRFKDFFAKYNLDTERAAEFNRNYQLDLGEKIFYCDGALEVLTKLKESGKYSMYAVTNGTKVAQQKKLNNSNLYQFFDDVIISEDTGYEKPSVEFFDAVFEVVAKKTPDFDKSSVMIIGDSLTSDIKGGNNAGIKTCFYNPGKKAINGNVTVDYEISKLDELLTVLS